MKFSETIGEFDGKPWDKLSHNDRGVLRAAWAEDRDSGITGVVNYIFAVNYGELADCVKAVACGENVSTSLLSLFQAAVNRQVMFEYERERKMRKEWLREWN